MRHRTEPAADVEREATMPVDDLRDRPDVVEAREPARMIRATGERDLELAPEVLRVVVAQEKRCCGFGVRRHVERLIGANTGVFARRHVAHGVPAGFARRHFRRGEPPHEVGCVVDVDEVELNVLPGRDVEDAVRVFLGACRHRLELVGRDLTEWELDSVHPGRVPQRDGALRELT